MIYLGKKPKKWQTICLYKVVAAEQKISSLFIYKFKIEMDGEAEKKITFREGEMKLAACENAVKDIKAE